MLKPECAGLDLIIKTVKKDLKIVCLLENYVIDMYFN